MNVWKVLIGVMGYQPDWYYFLAHSMSGALDASETLIASKMEASNTQRNQWMIVKIEHVAQISGASSL